MIRRFLEILSGIRCAAQFENTLEILTTRHIFRRKNSVPLVYQGMQIMVDSLSSDTHVVSDVLVNGMYDRQIRDAEQGGGRRSVISILVRTSAPSICGYFNYSHRPAQPSQALPPELLSTYWRRRILILGNTPSLWLEIPIYLTKRVSPTVLWKLQPVCRAS